MNCIGLTVKGIPCTRKVKEGEYCFQHIKIKDNEKIKDDINVKVDEKKDLETKTICIKVDNLRKHGYSDLEEWMNTPGNIYVGRRGRIFITYPDKSRKVFVYEGSKWGNPYKVDKENSVEMVCAKYKEY
jgi:hypothetical protein